MTGYKSSLAGRIINPPSDPAYIRGLAFEAWHKRGVVMIDPNMLTDDWERQAVINIANRIYGKRDQ